MDSHIIPTWGEGPDRCSPEPLHVCVRAGTSGSPAPMPLLLTSPAHPRHIWQFQQWLLNKVTQPRKRRGSGLHAVAPETYTNATRAEPRATTMEILAISGTNWQSVGSVVGINASAAGSKCLGCAYSLGPAAAKLGSSLCVNRVSGGHKPHLELRTALPICGCMDMF